MTEPAITLQVLTDLLDGQVFARAPEGRHLAPRRAPRDGMRPCATRRSPTLPAEKAPGPVSADAPLARRVAAVFVGTHAMSGSGGAGVIPPRRQKA
jgi:hypothetical protein